MRCAIGNAQAIEALPILYRSNDYANDDLLPAAGWAMGRSRSVAEQSRTCPAHRTHRLHGRATW